MNTARPDALSQDTVILQVYTLARSSAGTILCRDAADDIVQDVVLEFLELLRLGTIQLIMADLPGLVRTKVLRRFYDLHRMNKRRTIRDAEFLASFTDGAPAWMSPEIHVEEREITTLVKRTLASLSPACRTAWLMVRDTEATYDDVAREMGISRGSVCSHVVVAQRHLRTALADWLEERYDEAADARALPVGERPPVDDQRFAAAA